MKLKDKRDGLVGNDSFPSVVEVTTQTVGTTIIQTVRAKDRKYGEPMAQRILEVMDEGMVQALERQGWTAPAHLQHLRAPRAK